MKNMNELKSWNNDKYEWFFKRPRGLPQEERLAILKKSNELSQDKLFRKICEQKKV